MKLFAVGLMILLTGYFLYGNVVKKILKPDDRQTPAEKCHDGVDFLVLPTWKNMLIQLLNIAGIGPVIGVISGILFGDVVFIIIPIGCVLMGAVHDFVAGMMSMRYDGENLPALIKITTGKHMYRIFSVFLMLALLLVVAVFINIPAQLLAGLFRFEGTFMWSVCAIFLYYICATLFPIDKIIGRIYPIFGMLLLLGTSALLVFLVIRAVASPELLTESVKFKEKMYTSRTMPMIPMLFVTIACGILSGFHATQAPIVARTIKSEKQAFGVFFGMMIAEGFIAMVWAAGALAIYNLRPELIGTNPNDVLSCITETFLHENMSAIVIVSVIVLAITSGDTAMRSLRLSMAEMFHISQKKISTRLFMILPLILLTAGLLLWSNMDSASFQKLWTYFAWSNQVIAAFTLLAGTIYLFSLKRPAFITAVPGMFITVVVLTYILWIDRSRGGPEGLGLDIYDSYLISIAVAAILYAWAKMRASEISVRE